MCASAPYVSYRRLPSENSQGLHGVKTTWHESVISSIRMRDPCKICPKVFYLRKPRIHSFFVASVSGINSHTGFCCELLSSRDAKVCLDSIEDYEYLVHFVPLAEVSSCFRSANIAGFRPT